MSQLLSSKIVMKLLSMGKLIVLLFIKITVHLNYQKKYNKFNCQYKDATITVNITSVKHKYYQKGSKVHNQSLSKIAIATKIISVLLN